MAPEFEINDRNRTALQMTDWYAFKDPRQYYYGTYVNQRARLQENAENNYAFFEKRNLLDRLSEEVQVKLVRFLIPLRHVEQAANMNDMYGVSFGFGTALTQALCFDAMDRLGIAQYLSRIGLILDNNTGTSLAEAKQFWMDDDIWQGVRALCEESLVTKDWFELFVAQDLVIDSLISDLYYRQFDAWLSENGGHDVGMLTEFMQEWLKDRSRWLEAVLKVAAAESEHNRELLNTWVDKWRQKADEALAPLAEAMLGADALDAAQQALDSRLTKTGIK